MNPLTNVKNITKLNETELATGLIHKKSWHDMYKDSAWIFVGGLEYGLTEGDVLAVFSQYGEIENINLIRDKKTGKSKGYCFLCYSNQKSTVLAVDNFNGIKLCNRTIRVDHVANYKPPKESERDDEITKMLKSEGCAPQVVKKYTPNETKMDNMSEDKTKKKKSKKEKKEKKKKKRKYKSDSSDSEKEDVSTEELNIKKEKHDPGYDKYDTSLNKNYEAKKRKHHERSLDYSNGEYSHSKENSRSETGKKYYDYPNKSDHKIKTEPESDREYFRADKNNVSDKDRQKIKSGMKSKHKNDSNIHHISSKKHKRNRSLSSSSADEKDQTKYREKHRLENDKSESKKHSKHKMKSKKVEDSRSSSSDDASSTESSSGSEKHDDRYSKKDKHKTYYEDRSNLKDNRDNSYHRTGNSHTSSKSKHYDKTEKYNEQKSRTKYDDSVHKDDTYYKDSYYHKRQDKR